MQPIAADTAEVAIPRQREETYDPPMPMIKHPVTWVS